MKPIRKTFALTLAAMTLAGAPYFAMASEDIPPAGNTADPAAQAAPFAADNPDGSATQVFSIEDYQEMNDNIANSTTRVENSPALGNRYGRGVVIAETMETGEEEEDAVIETNAALENMVPIADNDTNAETGDDQTAAEQVAEDTENATNTTVANPDTGAADAAMPLLAAACALGAAPLVLWKRRK